LPQYAKGILSQQNIGHYDLIKVYSLPNKKASSALIHIASVVLLFFQRMWRRFLQTAQGEKEVAAVAVCSSAQVVQYNANRQILLRVLFLKGNSVLSARSLFKSIPL